MPISPEMVLTVEKGLPLEQARLGEAMRREAFYENDAEAYQPAREAETTWNYVERPKRYSGLTRQVVDQLSLHLYGSTGGPSRTWSDEAGDAALQALYSLNQMDGLMQECDKHSTLNDVMAIQFDADPSDLQTDQVGPDGKPVGQRGTPLRLITYTSQEFAVFCNPRCPSKVDAVVTIERFDATTTYRLWDEHEVRVFRTDKDTDTSGGRVAQEISDDAGPHRYGMIPFSFVWFDRPSRKFWVSSPGGYVASAEELVNGRLSIMEESICKNLDPILVATDVPATQRIVREIGRVIRLTRKPGQYNQQTASQQGGQDPKLELLSPNPNVEQSWFDLHNYLDMVRGNAGVPKESVSLEADPSSGVALLIRQGPLLDRAKARRSLYQQYECEIAKTALICMGNHYKRPELVASARAGKLTLAWQEPRVTVPGPDRDELDDNRIKSGYASRLQVICERYSCDRARGLEILKQIAQDRQDELAILGPEADAIYKAGVPGDPVDPADPGDQGDQSPGAPGGSDDYGDETGDDNRAQSEGE